MKFLMTSLVCGLLTIAAHAASTDTITFLTDAPIPVEQKVVEIHMTMKEMPTAQEQKKRKGKATTLPFSHATCSGSFIDGMGDILTARHCVDGFDSWDVVTYDGRNYKATVVATSTVHDLALIHIDRRNTPYFEPAEEVTRGETIFVLGSPLGITDTLSTGVIARFDGDVTLLDCSALPGNSGGPVYDKDGKLVGVLNAGFIVMFGVTHLNMAQGIDAVVFFVAEALAKRGR